MDEWLSLTEEVVPKDEEEWEILFDLHKVEGPATCEDNEDVVKVGYFLEVSSSWCYFKIVLQTFDVYTVYGNYWFAKNRYAFGRNDEVLQTIEERSRFYAYQCGGSG